MIKVSTPQKILRIVIILLLAIITAISIRTCNALDDTKKINELSESYKRLAENAKKFKNTQKEIADSTAKPFTINGSRAGVYGIDLAQTQLKKSSFYSEGKKGTYSQYDDVLSIQR